MRISSFFLAICVLLASGAMLKGQTAAEYGTIAAGTTGAITDSSKDVSKSIGGVFGRLGKGFDRLSSGQKGHQTATGTRARKQVASGRSGRAAASPAATPRVAPIVNASQIRIGMSRAELLSSVGEPSMRISATDQGVFSETYIYQSSSTVTVTLHDGKVAEVSPMPKESARAPALTTPPLAHSEAERPQ
jgi:hypothetical protein